MEAPSERAGRDDDVERYERLRDCALAGAPDGWRLGLALLERRGVAAWARTWQTTTPPRPAPPAHPSVEAPTDAGRLVGVLATMALACVASG